MKLNNEWDKYLGFISESISMQETFQLASDAYKTKTVYPAQENIFSCFDLTAPQDVRVVILGQDPYHNPGQANGLAFSVPEGFPLPPSLRNIYKELLDDLGVDNGQNGNLVPWAQQGVLLLNTCLTVEENKPNSHRNFGWDTFTDCVIETLGSDSNPKVFLLWGAHAQKKAKLIDESIHKVLKAPHPSPLSAYRGFWGSKPFSSINEWLKNKEKPMIHWQL